MAVRPKRYFTPEEYLLLEERASYKSEYDQGEIFPLRELEVLSDGTVAMARASPAHNRIVGNLIGLLFAELRGGPCTVYPSDVLVGAASGEAYMYPDVTVVCGEPVFDRSILANPALIIEVMSGSTAEYDRNLKFARYRTLDSFQEYLLVAQANATSNILYGSRIPAGGSRLTTAWTQPLRYAPVMLRSSAVTSTKALRKSDETPTPIDHAQTTSQHCLPGAAGPERL